MIRSPSRALKSIFSASTLGGSSSSPSGPGSAATGSPSGSFIANSTRRYHRRVSSSQAAQDRKGHRASPSESYLDLDSPLPVEVSVARAATRPSLDETSSIHSREDLPRRASKASSAAGPSRSRSRSRRPSFRSRTSSSNDGAAGPTAADRLAGAAKEVIDKLTSRSRLPHGRQPSQSSLRRSPSSPVEEFVTAIAKVPDAQACKTIIPPPRSDSRAAAATTPTVPAPEAPSRPIASSNPGSRSGTPVTRSSTPSDSGRRGRLPELAASRPRPKHLPVNPRPTSPPSPSISQLRVARPPTREQVQPQSTGTQKPFSAHVVAVPSADVLRRYELDELFVRLDVGGQAGYTTTVATLLGARDGGGKLGEFVEAALAQASAESESWAGSSRSQADAPREDPLAVPFSPFPFGNGASDDDHTLAFGNPSSPLDPLVDTAAGALACAHPFFLSLPAAPLDSLSLSPKAVSAAAAPGQRGLFVPSPTTPSGFKHKSIHPDITLSSTLTYLRSEDGSACSSSASASNSSGSPCSLSVSGLDGAELDEEDATTPSNRQPFFEIMRDQVYQPVFADGPEGGASTTPVLPPSPEPSSPGSRSVVVRESLSYPDNPRSEHSPARERDAQNALPEQASMSAFPVPARSPPAPPSPRSSSARRSEDRPASMEDRTVRIFLDRSDLPMPSLARSSGDSKDHPDRSPTVTTYAALVSFLRDSAFPALLVPPTMDSPPPSHGPSPTNASASVFATDPLLACTYLGTFATLKSEAQWLGLRAAEEQCDSILEHTRRALRAGQTVGSSGGQVLKKVQAERTGWI